VLALGGAEGGKSGGKGFGEAPKTTKNSGRKDVRSKCTSLHISLHESRLKLQVVTSGRGRGTPGRRTGGEVDEWGRRRLHHTHLGPFH